MTTASPRPPIYADRRGKVVWIAVLAVVFLAGIVAVIAARGSGEDDADLPNQVGEAVELAADSAAPLPAYEAGGADPAVGQTIPTVEGTILGTTDPMAIGPGDGAQLLMFVAHWCPHCQREVPRIVEHLAEDPLPDDVRLVTVSTAVTPDRGNHPPQRWLEDEGWEAPVLADDANQTVAATFGLSSFPYFVAVDDQGEVVARASGELTTEQFDALVDAARGGAS